MDILKTLAVAGALALGTALLPSCNTGVPVKTETLEYADSTAHAYVTVHLELPEAVTGKAGKIRETLIDVMDRQMSAVAPGEDGRLFPAFEGDRTKTDELFTYYRQQLMQVIGRLSQEDADSRIAYMENPAEFEMPSWGYEFNLEKIADTDRYAVFSSHNYLYMGGAHGGITGEGSLTFDKKDGHLVQSFLRPDCLDEIQPLLRQGLMRYYGENGEDFPEEKLMERLQIEGDRIPLPAWSPFPTEEGLTFTYQQYEIACYADGMPSFTIPYKDILPFIDKEAKKLVK